jgi:16S rRNA (adenine1518-N6/adenine1519-N6)-dimethyltransferase
MSSYLWQNFLIDSEIKNSIITLLKTIKDTHACHSILEIWPGKWALTQDIVQCFDDVLLVEKDKWLEHHLHRFDHKAKIVFCDILEYNISWLNMDTIVYWSLPYYITSPIIQKFFVQHHYNYGCFVVQKEFGEKIASDSKKKSYLRRLLNYRYIVTYQQTISALAFNPIPKVQSCIITIEAKKSLLSDEQFEKVRLLVEALGKFKRKTLHKSFWLLGWQTIIISWIQYTLNPKLSSMRLEECNYDNILSMVDIW